MGTRLVCRWLTSAWIAAILVAAPAAAATTSSISLRGRPQTLHLDGPIDGDPVVVSSGDGGWIHLAPQVSTFLAARGFFVVGFDTRAYLQSFTSEGKGLTVDEEPMDYRALIDFARNRTGRAPVLIGVSEGAALSVLAATSASNRALIRGVVGLGLGDRNELAWRWKDAIIYLTHAVPREPTFSVIQLVGQMAPVPLAVIHATHDEYVPVSEVEQILAAAREPKRLWLVESGDHRFSDRADELHQRLIEALSWIGQLPR